MTGYVRKDTTNNIADGNVINAADLDAEFDGVQDAFNASTGHNHDGTSGEGAPITALGPTQDVTISAILLAPKTNNTVDIGSSSLKFKDLFLAGNGSIGGTLAVTGVATLTANPVLSAGTANGVAYLNGSKVVTSGSALTFDGTNLGVANTSGADVTLLTLTSNSGIRQQFNPTNSTGTKYNWRIDVNGLVDQTWSLVPSTAVGGSTFSTPVYQTHGNGTQIWSVGSSEAMRLTSTGLGIGTSSPDQKIQIAGGSGSAWLHATNTANSVGTYIGTASSGEMNVYQAGAFSILFHTSSTLRATLDSSGRLGLGMTPSGSYSLQIYGVGSAGSGSARIRLNNSSTGTADADGGGIAMEGVDLVIQNSENGVCKWEINGSERARIDSDGNLLCGTTGTSWTDTAGFYAFYQSAVNATRNGAEAMNLNRLTSDGTILSFRRSGTQVGSVSVTTTATAYNTSSDYRLKDNLQNLTGSGEFIDALKPKTWNWKIDGSKGVGFLAHEAQAVSPSSVSGQKDAIDEEGNPIMQAMEYGSAEFIANIIAELQSLRQRVAQLEAQ